MKKFLLAAALLLSAAAAFFTYVYHRGMAYDETIAGEIASLLAQAEKPGIAYSAARLKGLPEPVQRYFKLALKEGTPPIRIAKVRLGGVIMTHPHGSWLNTGAEEYFDAANPGFVWHAKVRLSNIVWAIERYRYAGGKSSMEWRTYGAFGNKEIAGREADVSSLVHYLCESTLFPASLLPGGRVTWSAAAKNTARMALTDGPRSVSALATFNEKGEMVKCESGDGYNLMAGKDGVFPQAKWTLRMDDYKEFEGMKIPTDLAAEWESGRDTFAYAKFTVLEARYNAEGRFPPVKRKRKEINPLGGM